MAAPILPGAGRGGLSRDAGARVRARKAAISAPRLQRAVEDAVDLGRSADAASTQALLGQGSVTDVVLAVSRAEMALQTATTLRDKVVSAYQDVMRMPI